MLLKIRSSCPVISSVVQNWSSAKLNNFYKKVSVTWYLLSKTVSIHAISPQSYNCTSKDTITGGFLWMYLSKHFFIASFHASMRSQMFYEIDVPENPAKFTGNRFYQTLLTPVQISFWESFEIFRNTFFTEHLRMTGSDFCSIFILF